MVSRRFFSLFGVYYSLQYLSLSDFTVFSFLVPMCTAMAGALFLGENFSFREAFAGRKWILFQFQKVYILLKSVSVVSLVGVVLIARPTAIFGSASLSVPVVAVTETQLTAPKSLVEKGTQAERLIAVGYVITSISKLNLKILSRIALIGVLGASAGCK